MRIKYPFYLSVMLSLFSIVVNQIVFDDITKMNCDFVLLCYNKSSDDWRDSHAD